MVLAYDILSYESAVSESVALLAEPVTLPEPMTARAAGPALCPDPVLCRCLRVRESAVREAIETQGVESLVELRQCTGAGAGCTACHCLLKQYLLARRECA